MVSRNSLLFAAFATCTSAEFIESTNSPFPYIDVGFANKPCYEEKTGTANPFDGIDVGSYSAPALADVDGDGDIDLVVGESVGFLYYYENVGSAASPSYEEKTGTANPFDGIYFHNGYSAPALADLNGDGDLDLVGGEFDGWLYYYENVGSAASPNYVSVTGSDSPFEGLDVGDDIAPALAGVADHSVPALADVDGDGDLDLVVGAGDGTLYYFENVGSATSPSFAAVTGSDSPFDGVDAVERSAPAFGDVNGDGNLDLVVGAMDGKLYYYDEPTHAPTLTPAPSPRPTTPAPSPRPTTPAPSPLPTTPIDDDDDDDDAMSAAMILFAASGWCVALVVIVAALVAAERRRTPPLEPAVELPTKEAPAAQMA
ncbi:DNA-directed 5'-3' RNA polymerase [Aureococcus anophagefferens]|nr:DNA-directed 5'-3' RNA polymerase [Aureococcus anophagefferens]